MPCLAATYAALKGEPTSPWADAILMIRPKPLWRIAGNADRVV